jgi:hypothetical protein
MRKAGAFDCRLFDGGRGPGWFWAVDERFACEITALVSYVSLADGTITACTVEHPTNLAASGAVVAKTDYAGIRRGTESYRQDSDLRDTSARTSTSPAGHGGADRQRPCPDHSATADYIVALYLIVISLRAFRRHQSEIARVL